MYKNHLKNLLALIALLFSTFTLPGWTADSTLSNRIPTTGLSGPQGGELAFSLSVPANATGLNFEIYGGAGDADLYVRFNAPATAGRFDCRPYIDGNQETCAMPVASPGTWHVMLKGYRDFSNLSLVGSFIEDPILSDGHPLSGLNGLQGSEQHYRLDIPAGASGLDVQISGGSGDADLYLQYSSPATLSEHVCRPYIDGNYESCILPHAGAGTWHIMIRGYRDFSGLSLTTQILNPIPYPSADTINVPPSIGGNPADIAKEGEAYLFSPEAVDEDQDTLSFNVENQPNWLSFDATNGALSGTPTADDVGEYSGIVVSVSDGLHTTSLDGFDITVKPTSALLSWTAPVTRTDGSLLPISEIAGYKVYVGSSATELGFKANIPDPYTLEHQITQLGEGTYYFAVTTYDHANLESELSSVVSKSFE